MQLHPKTFDFLMSFITGAAILFVGFVFLWHDESYFLFYVGFIFSTVGTIYVLTTCYRFLFD